METELTTGWHLVGVVFDGQEILVAGVNPWAHDWTRGIGRIRVAHPQYPHQRHLLAVWQVTGTAGNVTFAAGELSNGVWAFYVPDQAG